MWSRQVIEKWAKATRRIRLPAVPCGNEGRKGYQRILRSGVNYNEGGDECFGHRSRPGAHSVHPCGAMDSRVILSNDADESGSMNGPKPMVVWQRGKSQEISKGEMLI